MNNDSTGLARQRRVPQGWEGGLVPALFLNEQMVQEEHQTTSFLFAFLKKKERGQVLLPNRETTKDE